MCDVDVRKVVRRGGGGERRLEEEPGEDGAVEVERVVQRSA